MQVCFVFCVVRIKKRGGEMHVYFAFCVARIEEAGGGMYVYLAFCVISFHCAMISLWRRSRRQIILGFSFVSFRLLHPMCCAGDVKVVVPF